MSIQPPTNPGNLELVAAYAAGELDPVKAAHAEELIAADPRYLAEFEAQKQAITALGIGDWYQPMTDLEKLRIKQAVVPKSIPSKKSWAVRSLGPLSVAAVLVVVLGFVGMNLSGGGDSLETSSRLDDYAADTTEAPFATQNEEMADSAGAADAAQEAPAQSQVAAESMTDETALKYSSLDPPPDGPLEPLTDVEVLSLEELFGATQWTAPVTLDRYQSLVCWEGEDRADVLGVVLADIGGIPSEVVLSEESIESRTTATCSAVVLPLGP